MLPLRQEHHDAVQPCCISVGEIRNVVYYQYVLVFIFDLYELHVLYIVNLVSVKLFLIHRMSYCHSRTVQR